MRWLVGVLICVTSARAARYGDYSGAKMPQYNVEYPEHAPLSDEYKDHSPDAAPALDYRYEEDSQDKVASTEPEDDEWFKRSNRKKKILKLSDDRIHLNRNNGLMSKFKFQKHRSRTKQNIESENKKHNDYETQYDNDSEDLKIDYPKKIREDKKVEPEYNSRYTTQKVIRRKARDRTISPERKERDDSDDDENIRAKFDDDNLEHRIDGHRRMSIEKDPLYYVPKKKKFNIKDYVEDEEYYDMKRVNSINYKIPELLRRTTEASAMGNLSLPLQDMSYRRVNNEFIITEIAAENVTTAVERIELIKTTAISFTKDGNQTSNITDLSLAEKSRLSILRKSLKKESVRNYTWTTKPPVLMHVTSKMQTIVMVEPHNDIQMRARDIFDDSSERIAKAKKLMRHKLVSGASSIQDLTDNWDEMVCDYIDVSLLENSSAYFYSNVIFISFILICDYLLLQ